MLSLIFRLLTRFPKALRPNNEPGFLLLQVGAKNERCGAMRNRNFSAWICLGLALGDCDQAANISPETGKVPDADDPPAVVTPFNQEVMALKARESDPDKVDAALPTTIVPFDVRRGSFGWRPYSTVLSFNVPAGGSFEAWTYALPPVDPSLIAFRQLTGTVFTRMAPDPE